MQKQLETRLGMSPLQNTKVRRQTCLGDYAGAHSFQLHQLRVLSCIFLWKQRLGAQITSKSKEDRTQAILIFSILGGDHPDLELGEYASGYSDIHEQVCLPPVGNLVLLWKGRCFCSAISGRGLQSAVWELCHYGRLFLQDVHYILQPKCSSLMWHWCWSLRSGSLCFLPTNLDGHL